MKTLQKTYTGKYAPNHLEFDYWIDLTANNKGSVIKTYNGTGWVEISGNSGEAVDAYTKAEVDAKFDSTALAITSVQNMVVLENTPYFTAYYNVTDTSASTALFTNVAGNWDGKVRTFVDGVEINHMDYYDSTNKVFTYQFNSTGEHAVKVYTLEKIIVPAAWNGNKALTRIDLSKADPDLLSSWQQTFFNSGLTEIKFPDGFYFDSFNMPFNGTTIKEFDISKFDATRLNHIGFLQYVNCERFVMREMTIPGSIQLPSTMSTLREVIIQDCDMSAKYFEMFQYASQMTSLQKIDLSGSKIKLDNYALGYLPSSVTQLVLDGVDFSNSEFAALPLAFGNYSGALDFSKCTFNYTDPFFTSNQYQVIQCSNCTELIWDGLKITIPSSTAMFGSDNRYRKISLRNATINITCANGCLLWYSKNADIDLTGATISGNINGLDSTYGNITLDNVDFDNATWVQSGPNVFSKSIVNLSTAKGEIVAGADRGIFAGQCTLYYDSTRLDLTDVVTTANTYSPNVIFVDTAYGESTPWKVSQLYDDTTGCTEATTTVSLVTDKNLVVATISANDTFSLASVPTAGKEIHTIVKNSSDADVVVTIPTESPYVNLSSDSITVPAGGYAEINTVSDGTNVYIRTL